MAAELLGRSSIGIDISPEAVRITKERLSKPIRSRSFLLEAGRESYEKASEYALAHLTGLDIIPVQRNKGIDALLKFEYKGGPVPVRVQRPGESLLNAASQLFKSAKTKHSSTMILIATQEELNMSLHSSIPPEVIVVDSLSKKIHEIIQDLKKDKTTSGHLTRA